MLTANKVSSWESLPFWTKFCLLYTEDFSNQHTLPILRLVSLVQSLTLILATVNLGSSSLSEWSFITMRDSLGFAFIDTSDMDVFIIIIIACYILALVVMLGLQCAWVLSKPYQPPHTRISSNLMTIHLEILFYPLTLFLMQLLVRTFNSQNDNDAIGRQVIMPLAMILIIVNFFLAFHVAYFCHSPIKSRKFISRKNSLHLLGGIVLKISLIILQTLKEKDQNSDQNAEEITAAVLSFVFSALIAVNTHFVMPEYRPCLLHMQNLYDALAIGISVSQIGAQFFTDKNLVLEAIFLLLPLWVIFRVCYFNGRLQKMVLNSMDHTINANDLLHLGTLYKTIKYNLTINPFKRKYKLETFEGKWLMYKRFQEIESNNTIKEEADRFRGAYYSFLKMKYEELIEAKSTNVLALCGYCELILDHFHMYPKVYHISSKLRKTQLRTPYRIALYEILSKAQDSMDRSVRMKTEKKKLSSDVLWHNRSNNQIFEDLKTQIHSYTKQAAEFWKLLAKEEADMATLYKKGTQTYKQELKIHSIWNKSSADFGKTHPVAYLIYGIFDAELLNLPHQGKSLMKTFESLTTNKIVSQYVSKTDDSNSVSIIISGEKNQLGTVLECSKNSSKIFGYEKHVLIGQNIKIIMPNFFQDQHDKFLTQYYETGRSTILNNETKLYAKDQTNNIFPITLSVSLHFDAHKGVIYTGIIKKIAGENQQFIMIKPDNKLIQETSSDIRKILNIESYAKINIIDICPDFIVRRDSLGSTQSKLTQNQAIEDIPIRYTMTRSLNDRNTLAFKPYTKLRNPTKPEQSFSYKVKVDSFSYNNQSAEVLILESLQPATTVHEDSDKQTLNNTLQAISEEDEEPPKEHQEQQHEPPSSCDTGPSRIPDEKEIVKKQTSSVLKAFHDGITTQISTIKPSATLFKSREIGDGSVKQEAKGLINSSTQKKDTFNEKFVTNYFKLPIESLSSSASSKSHQTQPIDQLQMTYSQRRPDNVRRGLTVTFIFLLAASLVTASVEHVLFQQAVQDISFAVDVIKTSYDRLDALVWNWRFVLVYETRINGMYTAVTADLARYKLVVASYQEAMREANNQLMQITSTQNAEDNQKIFYEKNVNVVFQDVSGNLKYDTLNSFDAFNLLLEELSTFSQKPQATLLQGNNPEVDFIMTNSVNDMLVVSENIVKYFGDNLQIVVDDKQTLLSVIAIMNILVMVAAALTVLVNFRNINVHNKKLFFSLTTIQKENIDNTINKLVSFGAIVSEKEKGEDFLVDNLFKIFSATAQAPRSKKMVKQKFARRFDDRAIFKAKLKQTAALLIFMLAFAAISFYKSQASLDSFNELVQTNNRLVVASKAQYTYNLVIGTAQALLAFQNTTTMRNQPVYDQLLLNLEDIMSNQFLTDTYLDSKTHEFVDPLIETLFESTLCPYLPDFPGSVITTNCLKATQNQTIGLYAVNMQYYMQLNGYAVSFASNPSYANSKVLFSDLTANAVPKFYTTVGAYIVVGDIIGNMFDDQVSYFKSNENKNYGLLIGFMSVMVLMCIYYLIRKINDDDVIKILLRAIPYQEIIQNKLLKSVVLNFYKGKVDYLRRT